MIEKAAGGTLFLDEIGDLPVVTQVKLLRLIQEQCYQRIGSDAFVNTDARIVVATNVDIKDRVSKGLFRTDLFYRLNTHHIHLPPLRDRKEDIPFLVDKFLGLAAEELEKKKPNVPSQLYTLLCTYAFPGNVRELRGMVFDAMSRHVSGTLSMESFRLKLQLDPGADKSNSKSLSGNNEKKVIFSDNLPTLKEVQNLLIEEALKASDRNQSIAAGILGMSRRALNSRISRQ